MVILPPYRGHTVYLAQDMPDPRACHMPTRDTLAAAPIDDFDDMPALVPIDDFDDMPTLLPMSPGKPQGATLDAVAMSWGRTELEMPLQGQYIACSRMRLRCLRLQRRQ